MYHILRRFF